MDSKLDFLLLLFLLNFTSVFSENDQVILYQTGFEDITKSSVANFATPNSVSSNGMKWNTLYGDFFGSYNNLNVITGKVNFVGFCKMGTTNSPQLKSDYFDFGFDTLKSISFKYALSNEPLNIEVSIEKDETNTIVLAQKIYKPKKNEDIINIESIAVTSPFKLIIRIFPSSKFLKIERSVNIDDIILYGNTYIEKVKAPKIIFNKNEFLNTKIISLYQEENRDIYYTIDGTEPDFNSTKYTAPIEIDETVTIKAVSYSDNNERSFVTEQDFIKITPLTSFIEFIESSNNKKTYFSFADFVVTSCNDDFIILQNDQDAFILKNNGLNISQGNCLSGWFSGSFRDNNLRHFIADDFNDIIISYKEESLDVLTYELSKLNNDDYKFPVLIKLENIKVLKNIEDGKYSFIQGNTNLKIADIIINNSDNSDFEFPYYCDIICLALLQDDKTTIIIPDVNNVKDKTGELNILFPPVLSIIGGTKNNPTKIKYGEKVKIISLVPDVIFLDINGNEIEDEITISSSLQKIEVCASKDNIQSDYICLWFSAYLDAPLIEYHTPFDNNCNIKIISEKGASLFITHNNTKTEAISPEQMKVYNAGKISCYATINDIISDTVSVSLSKIEKYIIGTFYNDKFCAMSSIIKSEAACAYEVWIDENNEAYIFNKNVVWDIRNPSPDNPYEETIMSNEGKYLNASRDKIKLSLSGSSTNWIWGTKKKDEDNKNNDSVYFVKGSSSSNNFLKFRYSYNYFKNFNASSSDKYSETLKRYKVGNILFNEKISENDIVKLCENRFLKFADLSQCSMSDIDIKLICANPNCLIYLPPNVNSINPFNILKKEDNFITCDYLVLTDYEPFNTEIDFYAKKALYSRNAYTDGGWESIIIPFDVPKENMPKGFHFEKFISINDTSVTFQSTEFLEAHTPYIMRWKGDISDSKTLVEFRNNDGCFINSNYKNSLKTSFCGTYLKRSAQDDYILVSDENKSFFALGTEKSSVSPFRATLKINRKNNDTIFKLKHFQNTIVGNDIEEEKDDIKIYKGEH